MIHDLNGATCDSALPSCFNDWNIRLIKSNTTVSLIEIRERKLLKLDSQFTYV